MKYIKYLFLGLAVSLMSTSCEERTVEFDWYESAGKVSYQVYNMNLMSTSSKNAIKYLYVGHSLNDENELTDTLYTHTNNHSALISPYNFAPSGAVGAFYTIDPCSQMAFTMYTEQSDPQFDELGAPVKNWDGTADSIIYTTEKVYSGEVQYDFKADKKYYIFVDNYNADPIVIEEPGAPIQDTDAVDSLDYGSNKAGLRLFNFFHDEDGSATKGKVKYYAKTKSKGDYRFETDWIEYGKASEWYSMDVFRTDPNSSGYEVIYCDIAISYDNGDTEEIIVKNDYWTTYIGRAYTYIVVGDKAKKTKSPEIKRFTAL